VAVPLVAVLFLAAVATMAVLAVAVLLVLLLAMLAVAVFLLTVLAAAAVAVLTALHRALGPLAQLVDEAPAFRHVIHPLNQRISDRP